MFPLTAVWRSSRVVYPMKNWTRFHFPKSRQKKIFREEGWVWLPKKIACTWTITVLLTSQKKAKWTPKTWKPGKKNQGKMQCGWRHIWHLATINENRSIHRSPEESSLFLLCRPCLSALGCFTGFWPSLLFFCWKCHVSKKLYLNTWSSSTSLTYWSNILECTRGVLWQQEKPVSTTVTQT